MGKIVLKRPRRFNMLAWMLASLLLLGVIVTGSFTLRGTHAAPVSNSQLNGSYFLRATTTSGPKQGLYITGVMAISVSGTTISGIARGLSYAPSSAHAIITGTTSDNIHVTLTIGTISHVKMPAINLTGAFQTSSGGKGSFTGFKGSFSFGTGPNTSSGTWEGIQGTAPSATGTWHIYLLIKLGQDKGTMYTGTLTLTQVNTKVTGTFCLSHGSCMPVKGNNLYGFVLFDMGTPTAFVLQGTFAAPGKGYNARMDGSFYMPGKGIGKQNDRGYWVATD